MTQTDTAGRGRQRGLASACLGWFLAATLPVPAADPGTGRMLPVRGFCIPAPSANRLDEFIRFIAEGLDVVSCSWKNPEAAAAQVQDMARFRQSSTPQRKQHFQGVLQTIWSGSGGFLDEYYARRPARDSKNPGHTEAKCFVRMFDEISKLR